MGVLLKLPDGAAARILHEEEVKDEHGGHFKADNGKWLRSVNGTWRKVADKACLVVDMSGRLTVTLLPKPKKPVSGYVPQQPSKPLFAEDWKVNEAVISRYLTLPEGLMSDTVLEAATTFEYARANADMKRAAVEYQQLKRSDKPHALSILCKPKEPVSPAMWAEHEPVPEFPGWLIQTPWSAIWQSASFPAKHWIELTPKQREPILLHLGYTIPTSRPLDCQDVRHLEAGGILKQFEELALTARIEKVPGTYEARLGNGRGVEHVIFTINWREGRKVIKERFGFFVDRSRAVSEKWHEEKRGKNKGLGKFKTALRDLFATYLFRTKGIDCACKWTQNNHLKDNIGKAFSFFGFTDNEGPLYYEGSQWREADKRALENFQDLFPVEG